MVFTTKEYTWNTVEIEQVVSRSYSPLLYYTTKDLENSTVEKIPKALGKSKEGLHYETMESMPYVK